jgi:NitT/TauT family transport system substrate-binding protein
MGLAWAACFYISAACVFAQEKVRIGVAKQTISAAVFAAKDLGYFDRAGVEVELVEFALGKEALAEMFAGRLDFALAAETPLVHAAIAGDKFVIVATVGRSSTALALVGRKDRGMFSFRDVRGRRIGVTRGTNAEFFFDSFRVLNAISKESVQVVEVAPEQLVQALVEGSVDGVCAWEPYLTQLRSQFGEEAFYFDGGGIYKWCWNLATTQGFLEKEPKAADKVLKALAETGEAFEKDRGMIASVLERRFGGTAANAAARAVEGFDYRPHLTQQLVLQMEAQHRWAAAGSGAQTPNFLRYIQPGPLARVSPGAVNLIE